MKDKKLVIGVIVVLVILAIFGAYWLGRRGNNEISNRFNPSGQYETPTGPFLNEDNYIAPIPLCNYDTKPWIKVINPNGGENINLDNSSSSFNLTWKTCNIPSNSYIDAQLIDLNNQRGGSALLCEGGSDTWGEECLNDGEQYITLNYKNTITGEYKIRIGLKDSILEDFSDKSFTIFNNSGENSTSEVFMNQPGEIKLIKNEGNNKWTLEIDLLSHNSKWSPGNDINEDFFINQNTKIRDLNATNITKTFKCGMDGIPNVLQNTSDFINDIQKGEYKNRYFDINGNNIIAMYEQCLP